MLRVLLICISAILASTVSLTVKATLQTDITAACATGGVVNVPVGTVINSTLNLTCPPGNLPVTLAGQPTRVVCNTGSAPCIVVGSTLNGAANFRENLSMRSLYLVGPGRTTVNSEGVLVKATADSSTFEDIKIDGFAVGLHVQAPSDDLLSDVMFDKIRIGVKGNPSNPSVNMAIHLDGFMGNIHFTSFQFSGWQRILLFDGPAEAGSDASFTEGTLNLTKTPGTPAVEVSTTSGLRMLQLSQIQDWETAVPFLELKNGANVTLEGIGISGDVMDTPAYPSIHTEAGAFGTLTISNSKLAARSSGANLIKLDAVGVLTQISNSVISGVITFNNVV